MKREVEKTLRVSLRKWVSFESRYGMNGKEDMEVLDEEEEEEEKEEEEEEGMRREGEERDKAARMEEREWRDCITVERIDRS